jgi:hypothetical protein
MKLKYYTEAIKKIVVGGPHNDTNLFVYSVYVYVSAGVCPVTAGARRNRGLPISMALRSIASHVKGFIQIRGVL